MSERAYLLNEAQFALEVIDDEIIVLNVTEGTYYAFGGWVVEIWEGLTSRQSVTALVDGISCRYGRSADIVRADLDAFVDTLLGEQILLEAATSDQPALLDVGEPAGEFRPISYEKHDDMQALLTLDPLHDVDLDGGWPKPRQI